MKFFIIFVVLLAFLGPFMPFLLSKIVSKGRRTTRELLLISSAITTLIYFSFVSLPYHFQGYQDLTEASPTSEILGLVNLEPIKTFDYIYVSLGMGRWWLFVSLLFVTFGDLKSNNLSITIKVIIVLTISICFFYQQNYEDTIGMVLE